MAVSKLPPFPLLRSSVDLDGHKVEIRALSRAEILQLARFQDDPDAGEDHVLAAGAEIDIDEAREWRRSTPPEIAGLVVDAILELSGLTEGAQKSGGTGDRPG